MRRRMLSLSTAIAFAMIPGGIVAQACLGAPVGASQNAITAQVGLPNGAKDYGASFRHDADGPLSVAAGYTLSTFEDLDANQHGFAGEVDYELPDIGVSACPTVGLSYTTLSYEGASVNTLSVPVGVGVGKSFGLSSDLSLNPYVVPQWIWMRATAEADGEEASFDDSRFAARVGATVAMPRFYIGGGLTWYNEEEMDPVFAVFAGLPF